MSARKEGFGMDDDAKKSAEDSIENEASKLAPEAATAQADVMLEGARQEHEKENQSMRNKLLLALLAVILFGVGGFLLFGGSSDNASETTANTENNASEANETSQLSENAEPLAFDKIVYAHAATEGTKRSLFSRPVTGGDRTDLSFDFGINSYVTTYSVGDAYVFANRDREVYYGVGEEEPTLIHTAADDVADVRLDTGSGTVLVLERNLDDLSSVQTLASSVPINGGEPVVFLSETSTAANVFYLEHWDGDNQLMYGRRSCTQCDGYEPDLIRIDGNDTEQDVFDADDSFNTATGYTFNADGTKALYTESTIYTQAEKNNLDISSGLGGPNDAPFTLMELDLVSGNSREVVTFGSADDVDNGFFPVPVPHWADGADGQRIAYGYQQLVHVQNSNGSFDNYFETGQGNVQAIYRIDDDEVVVGARNDEGQTISYFNIDTQEGAIVMETLFTTSILGVTLR